MNRLRVRKSTFLMLLPIFLIGAIGKIYEYNFMGENAFKLINYVLNGIYNGMLTGHKSVDFPIKVLSIFKIFNLNTPTSSGIFCAVIMNLVCFIILLNFQSIYSFKEYIFIYLTIFILNFTVFDFSKDIIQFWIVLFLYWIIFRDKFSVEKKIVLSVIVLLLETILFRSYYILLCGLFPMIYFVLKDINKEGNDITKVVNKKKIFFKIILILVFFFSVVYIMKFLSYESYIELITRRENLDNIEANTMIRNLIPGYTYQSFCINYFINLLRCLFPIELFLKGGKYIIFALYALYITVNILKALRRIDETTILPVSFILSYCMTLAASESDFGTFVRHQSVLIMFYLFIIVDNHHRKAITKYEYDKSR